MERVGTGDQGFMQDAVTPDAFQGDAARLVLIQVVRGDRPGPRALIREIRTCRLAVSGQVARRYSSQASKARRVRSPRGCRWPARVMRRLGRSMSSRVSSRMAWGRAACTAASAMASRWAGVTAACTAAWICSAVIGSMVRPAPRPPLR